MRKLIKYVLVLTTMFSCGFVLNAETVVDKKFLQSSLKRVPAEWEPQEATWLQWPGRWEKDYEEAIAKISDIISRYQTLHILYSSNKILKEAKDAILSVGADPENPNIDGKLLNTIIRGFEIMAQFMWSKRISLEYKIGNLMLGAVALVQTFLSILITLYQIRLARFFRYQLII